MKDGGQSPHVTIVDLSVCEDEFLVAENLHVVLLVQHYRTHADFFAHWRQDLNIRGILSSGFCFSRSIAMRFPIDALRAVLDYLWVRREEDYEEHYREDCSSGHIFLDLQELKAWLESQ